MQDQSKITMKTWKNGTRHYFYDGIKCPSVTTVIKELGWNREALMNWQNRLWEKGIDPRSVSKEACDVGTVTHQMIECLIYNQDAYTPPEGVGDDIVIQAVGGLKDYKSWAEEKHIIYLESELKMVSGQLAVAGTCDGIIEIDGKTVLIDFKTSKTINKEHIVQLAAYRAMAEETTDYKIDECMLIHIDKGEIEKGHSRITPHYIPSDLIDEGLDVFKKCLELRDNKSKLDKFLRQANKKNK